MKKVYINKELKGLNLSKNEALKILDLETSVNTKINDINICIYRDDFDDVFIDFENLEGGNFVEVKEYKLWVLDKNGDICYGWGKFERVEDLWDLIGWLCNESQTEIKITYLEYYHRVFETIETYIEKIKNNKNNLIARISFNGNNYTINLEEK